MKVLSTSDDRENRATFPLKFCLKYPNSPSRIQEASSVLGKDKTIYLRIGKVKFNAQLRKIPDQEEGYVQFFSRIMVAAGHLVLARSMKIIRSPFLQIDFKRPSLTICAEPRNTCVSHSSKLSTKIPYRSPLLWVMI
jgi:hypothetical protein